MALAVYTGNFGKAQILHLLRRTLFGFSIADLKSFEGKTLSETVDMIVSPATKPLPPVNYADPADTEVPLGQTWVNAQPFSGTGTDTISTKRRDSLADWSMRRMINQEAKIQEKMSFFWFNHIPAQADYQYAYEQYYYYELMWDNALGNFKTLIKKISTSTAMLNYLNGKDNTAKAPNENFARELLELFTIGKDTSDRYTEQDVQQAAKVLTGWVVDNTTNIPSVPSSFLPSRHDLKDKTFSAFFNNTTILGRSNAQAGEDELNDLVNLIFTKDEVALFLVRKLIRFFCYYDITPQIESTVVVPLAQTFKTNNYEILPVLKELFLSDFFFSSSVVACKIKNPLEMSMSAIRLLNWTWSATVDDTYKMTSGLDWYMGLQGLSLQNPPSVSGWPAYYQSPSYHELWITSSNLRSRKDVTNALINGWNNNFVDLVAFAQSLQTPSDPNLLIDEALELLHPTPSDTSTKATLKAYLLSNQSQDYYWTDAWNQYIAHPSDTTYRKTVESRLKSMFNALLAMAEFQLH